MFEEFKTEFSDRIVQHPDTPASYVEWKEIIPLLNERLSVFVGNLLGWSFQNSCKPLGSSWEIFQPCFSGCDESTFEEWMFSLRDLEIADFIDHHLPFLWNIEQIDSLTDKEAIFQFYLFQFKEYKKGTADKYFSGNKPSDLLIELTQSCNFSCIMCSSNTGGYKPEKTLKLNDFGELVRTFAADAKRIRINGYGESTIVPNLKSYVDCFDEFNYHGLKEVITNLSAKREVYWELAKNGFVVLISWDSTNPQEFMDIRIGSNFNRLNETIRSLNQVFSDEKERFGIICTLQEKNCFQIVPITNFANEIGAGLLIFNVVKEEGDYSWMESNFERIVEDFKKAIDIAEHSGLYIKVPDHLGKKPVYLQGSKQTSCQFCDRPWNEVMIRYDLDVDVCNMFNPFTYGQIYWNNVDRNKQNMDDRFFRLWNGPNARLFRFLLSCEKRLPYCRECYYM